MIWDWLAWFFWIFVFVPFLTALVYAIVRGGGMRERSLAQAGMMRDQQDAYIRATVGGRSAADEVAEAKALLDGGTISQEEFDLLKSKAVARWGEA